MDWGQIFHHSQDLILAFVLALPIGWERERNDQSAGLRTFPLVAIASCGFVIATESYLQGHPEARASIIQGVITGVGFIGGGAILKTGNSVSGTATAASIWNTGAIGAATGLGSYEVAIVLSVVNLLTFFVLSPLKKETAALPEKTDS